jgi:hypothetical protein
MVINNYLFKYKLQQDFDYSQCEGLVSRFGYFHEGLYILVCACAMCIDGFENCIELIVVIFPVNVNFSMLAYDIL